MNIESTGKKEKIDILVVDDEKNIVEGLKVLLAQEGFEVLTAFNGFDALKKIQDNEISVALVDIQMPKLDGLELFSKVKKRGDNLTQFIFITGKGTISTAVEAMKAGAYDYLTKPVEPHRIKSIIPKAIEHYNLLEDNQKLKNKLENLTRYENIIGESDQMKDIFKFIDVIARSSANVIITGPSGTGKELVAKAIHQKSEYSTGPYIPINCAALPKDILENELFGHEKGAFTGAIKEKPGCFELADGGTLFLDEIGEMTKDTQAKILRVLEEKKYRRLGGKNEIKVDTRIIAATNQDPNIALREDLFYRLSVFEIDLPPLRERIADIELLLLYFLAEFNKKNRKDIKGFSPECLRILNSYSWPGNVRELKNIVERTVVLCNEKVIQPADLPNRIFSRPESKNEFKLSWNQKLEDIEKICIIKNLESTEYNKTKTAKQLGISLKTLYNKLEKYNL